MVASLRAAWGPEFNDYELYDPDDPDEGDIVLGSTLSPVLPSGTYAFRSVNQTATITPLRGKVGDNFGTAEPYTWLVLEEFRADGTFGSGDNFHIYSLWAVTGDGNGRQLRAYGQADGKYKVSLNHLSGGLPVVDATSSSSYSSTDWITIRVQYDGSRIKVWIDDTLEMDFASTTRPMNGRIQFFYLPSDMATVTKYWSGYACLTSNSASDRPGTNLGRHRLTPNFNTLDTDSGDKVDCSDTSLGDWRNWDDWVGGGQHNGDTDYNCFPATADPDDIKEISSLSTATVSDDVLGVIVHQMRKASAGEKVMNNYAVLQYSGTESEIELYSASTTAYYPNSVVFVDPPDGQPWTQTKITGLEVGTRTPFGNGASLLVTAVGVEVFTIDSDPPPPQDRRRALHQVN